MRWRQFVRDAETREANPGDEACFELRERIDSAEELVEEKKWADQVFEADQRQVFEANQDHVFMAVKDKVFEAAQDQVFEAVQEVAHPKDKAKAQAENQVTGEPSGGAGFPEVKGKSEVFGA